MAARFGSPEAARLPLPLRWVTRLTPYLAAFALTHGVLVESASANGRFPEAQRLIEHPGDPERLYLAGTWGMLLTHDRGTSWSYLCEGAFARTTLEGDPLLEVLPSGTLLAGIVETLNRSTDCGCSWPPVLGQAETEHVVDLTQTDDGRLLALIQDVSSSFARSSVSLSSDDGQTWRTSALLPEDIIQTYTLDVAPSMRSRLYVSGFSRDTDQALLLVSDDEGQTWARRPMPGTTTSFVPYIAAVHPSDADQVFIRTDRWEFADGFAASDALWVTRDAGQGFEVVLERQAKLLGFTLSPDAETVLAGYGDPVLSGLSANAEDFGIYKASTSELSFERILDLPVSCLRWTAHGLYVCAVQNHSQVPAPGLALGFSESADFAFDPLTPLLDLALVAGPSRCTASLCAEAWTQGINGTPAVCQQLRADCSADRISDGLSCASEQGGAGGQAGAAAGGAAGEDTGSGGDGTGGEAEGLGGIAGTAIAGQSGDCGCHLAGPKHPPTPYLAAFSAAAWAALRRRQRTIIRKHRAGANRPNATPKG